MLWKKELERGKLVYVALFEDYDGFSACHKSKPKISYILKSVKHNESMWVAFNKAQIMFAKGESKTLVLAQMNAALCLAEFDRRNDLSKIVGVIYANRAAVTCEMGEFSLALENVKLAKRNDFPADLFGNLDKHKEKFQKELDRKGHRPLCEPKLSFPADSRISCFANGLEVTLSKEFGKHIITNRDLEIGQTVIIEEAFCMAPEKEQYYLQCANCFERKSNLIPCKNCSASMFCSQICSKMDHQGAHALECGISGVYSHWETSAHLVMRTVVAAIELFPNVEQLINVIEEFNGKPQNEFNYADPSISRYMQFFGLSQRLERASKVQQLKIIDYAQAIHSVITSNPKYQPWFQSSETRRFLAHLILHHYYIVDANGLDAYSLIGGSVLLAALSDRKFQNGIVYARGIYLNSCHLNHSCQPNATRIFMGNKLVVKVIRAIKQGEQLLVSYL